MPIKDGKSAILPSSLLSECVTTLRDAGVQCEDNATARVILEKMRDALRVLSRHGPSASPPPRREPSSPEKPPLVENGPEPESLQYGPTAWADLASGRRVRNKRWQMIVKWAGDKDPEILHRELCYGRLNPYDQVNDMMRRMEAEGMAPSTMTVYRGQIGTFYRYANYTGFRSEMFQSRVKKSTGMQVGQTDALKIEEVQRIIRESKHRAAHLFLALTGCRRGEAHTLKWKDIDYQRVSRVPMILFKDTKTDEPRYFPLPQWSIDVLKNGRDHNPEERIFADYTYQTMYDYLMKDLRDMGITEYRENLKGEKKSYTITPHSYRTFAKDLMIEKGMTMNEAEWLVGHDIGVPGHYMRIETVSEKWMEKVEPFYHQLAEGDDFFAGRLYEKPPLIGGSKGEISAPTALEKTPLLEEPTPPPAPQLEEVDVDKILRGDAEPDAATFHKFKPDPEAKKFIVETVKTEIANFAETQKLAPIQGLPRAGLWGCPYPKCQTAHPWREVVEKHIDSKHSQDARLAPYA